MSPNTPENARQEAPEQRVDKVEEVSEGELAGVVGGATPAPEPVMYNDA